MVLEVVLVVQEVLPLFLLLQLLALRPLLLQLRVLLKLPSPLDGKITDFDTQNHHIPPIWEVKQAFDNLPIHKLDLPDPIFGVPEL